MKEDFNAKKAQWENEKGTIGRVQKLREELEEANAALTKAQREYDLNRAAELQYGRIPQLQKELEASEAPRSWQARSSPRRWGQGRERSRWACPGRPHLPGSSKLPR